MRYRIISDNPGRMRVRFGGYAFDKMLESCICKLAMANFFALSAEAHSANGSLLICYKKGHRADVIKFIESLDFRSMTPVTEDNTTREIDNSFKKGLIRLGISHAIRKLLVPAPFRPLFVAYRASRYILKGLSSLAEGKLTVEVLDAASITACLVQRNFSTARTIMLLLSVSSLLEEYTHARTKAVLTSSLAVKADKVWLVNGNEDVLIPIKELVAGDKIRVRTGSVIPVDGEITEGEAYINEASMTGESLAVMKSENATVFAGTVIEEGSIVVKVRAVSSETKIQKIIELIDSSENLKAGIQSRAERLADGIVSFSFLGFGLTLLLTGNITKAVSLLMVDYSCAIKLSTPISVISAIREAADRNITVKGGKYLEAFAAADTIVFDKTGTLTNAEPVLQQVIPFGSYTEEEILRTAACIEEHFPHSMARAIVKGAENRGVLHAEEHAEVNYIVAHGIATTLHGQRAIIGSRHFVCEDEGVVITDEQQTFIDEKAGASSVIYLALGGQLAGVLCINDPPRSEAADAVRLMKKGGIEKVVMLTGDSSFLCDCVACCDCHNECDNCNHYVEESGEGNTVTSHIVSCELYSLIGIHRNILGNNPIFSDYIKEIFAYFLCLNVIGRRVVVLPRVRVVKTCFSQFIKAFFCHHCHTELYSLKHHIRRILIKCTVIGEGNKGGNFVFLSVHNELVIYRKAVVVCIHSVNCNLVRVIGQFALHNANLVKFLTIFKDTQCAVYIFCFTFNVEIFVDFYICFFKLFNCFIISLAVKLKITVLDIVFFKAFVISNFHTARSNHKARYKANHYYHKQENNRIFSEVALKLSWQSFDKWIFHFNHSFPLTSQALLLRFFLR